MSSELIERLRRWAAGQVSDESLLVLFAEAADTLSAQQAELDRAWLRLGTLGLSPKMDTDVADICAKLGTMVIPAHKTWPTHHRNPDGPDAAAVIERLNAQVSAQQGRIEGLEAALKPFAKVAANGPADATDEDFAAVRFADLRKARAILSPPADEKEKA